MKSKVKFIVIIIFIFLIRNLIAQESGWINDQGKYRYIFKNGEKTDWFDSYDDFNKDSIAVVYLNSGKTAFMNNNGQIISEWDRNFSIFHDGIAYAYKDNEENSYVYVNRNGKIIASGFKNCSNFENGLGWVILKNGNRSIVDTNGKLIYDENYYLERFNDSIFYCKKKDLNNSKPDEIALINKKGQLKTDWYNSIKSLNNDRDNGYLESLFKISKDLYDGYINDDDRKTRKIIHKYGFMDKNFKVIIDCQFEEATFFNKKGVAIVKKNNKWICIDINGIQQGEPYDEINIKDLENKLIRIKLNGKLGYINESSNLIIKPEFDVASSFDNMEFLVEDSSAFKSYILKMAATVTKDGKTFVINENGECIKWCP